MKTADQRSADLPGAGSPAAKSEVRPRPASHAAPGEAEKAPAGRLNEGTASPSPTGGAAGEETLALMELLFFAYRDFIADPDAILESKGFGRAHHRVLHFVSRYPGLRVADLLDILRITKQSLARVLKQLVDEGYIVQEAGRHDRRERHLFVTEAGRALTQRLAEPQIARVEAALATAAAGGPGDGVVGRFLFAMIAADQRPQVARLMAGSDPAAGLPDATASAQKNEKSENETV